MTKQAKAIVTKKDYLDGKPCVSVIGKINNPSGQPILFNIICAVDTACSTGVFIADISMDYLKAKGVKLTMDTIELADGKTRMIYSCLGTIQTIDGQGFILPFEKDIVVSVSSVVTDAVSLLGLDALKYFVTICDGQKGRLTISNRQNKNQKILQA